MSTGQDNTVFGNKKVLEGIRVIDTTAALAGPMAAGWLVALGAEVIKVERIGGELFRGATHFLGVPITLPSGKSIITEQQDRGKKSIGLDFSKPGGREIIYRLVKNADVLMTNFIPPVCHQLQMDYETIKQYNPKIIYGYSTMFGERGPDSDLGGYDLLGQARSGLSMTSFGEGEPPVQVTLPTGDLLQAITLVLGIISALLVREREGIGQKVEVSQLGSLVTIPLCTTLAIYLGTGNKFLPYSWRKPRNALWNFYRCKDGKWLALTSHLEANWHTDWEALGIPELEYDPRFDTLEKRTENSLEIAAIVNDILASKTFSEWDGIFRKHNLHFSIANNLEDLPLDPQIIANDYIVEIEGPDGKPLKVPGFPVRFNQTPAKIGGVTPVAGQDTELILTELCGYSWAEVEKMKDEKIIG